jgi:hypothetical protein
MAPMSDERATEPTEPRYGRLRSDLRRWVDTNPHDPGVTLAELFAYLADVIGTYQDRVAAESRLGSSRFIGIRLQEGRVTVDADWNDQPDQPRRFGLYRGVVIDSVDPLGKGRLRVEVPNVTASAQPWALPSLGPGTTPALPAPGAIVWVAFEEGDVDRPVWLGVVP